VEDEPVPVEAGEVEEEPEPDEPEPVAEELEPDPVPEELEAKPEDAPVVEVPDAEVPDAEVPDAEVPVVEVPVDGPLVPDDEALLVGFDDCVPADAEDAEDEDVVRLEV